MGCARLLAPRAAARRLRHRVPDDALRSVDRSITVAAFRADPDAYVGYRVTVYGDILARG